MVNMIESIQELPVTLTNNAAVITFSNDDVRTRSATCCNNGWLQHQEGSPLYQILDGGYYIVTFHTNASSAAAGVVAFGLYEDRNIATRDDYCVNISCSWRH
jgi:hypothetical protein